MMEYRISAVRTLQHYTRGNPTAEEFWGRWDVVFMVIGLENRRHMENWLKIELSGPDMEGTVTFGTTLDALSESRRADRSVRSPDDTMPVTHFAQAIQDTCELHDGPIDLYAVLVDLEEMYARDPDTRKH
ncbi:hypothetical protein BS47DRAFT_244289 [Hydnum rufescens UP504]|uniref:Uncharacterized protein n=1 Tax=Hydnum rufescens UP504 TaxID=1448309 RepID=A0A9P6ALW5_9AGAM|nr:hypothetical protein BS47DRAFT_244289 [Hydnum rufescens UP504]